MNAMLHRASRRLAALGVAGLAAVTLLLAACGGGVGEGGTGGGMSYSQGTVEGLGSVIVGGVRYDDSNATVTDVDGNPRSAAVLGLGMAVEIEAGDVGTAGGRPAATATAIRYTSEMLGPVGAVDAAAQRVTVLGQAVAVDAGTVFGAPLGGLGDVAVGATLEIHAELDLAAGLYRATRIDRVDDATVAAYRLRGVIGQRDERNKRFTIGAATFDYSGVPPAGINDGRLVRLKLQKTPGAGGVWTVTEAAAGARTMPEGREARLSGRVTALEAGQSFSLNGQSVNAAGLTLPSGFGLGARVDVVGRIAGNAVRATQVTLAAGSPTGELLLIGSIGGLDTVARSFQVRGQTVTYNAGVTVTGGTLSDLANGRRAEVRGTLGPGGVVVAQRIDLQP